MTSGLPVLSFQVAFSGTKAGNTVPASPNDPNIVPTWTDLTHRLRKITTKRGKSTELDQAQSVEMQLELKNTDGALDPGNTSSPYYPYVLPLRQFRLQLTYSGTTYTLVTGFIESWPQTWELHGYLGWVNCTAVDAIAALSQIVLPSCLEAEVLLDSPFGYWPLGEPSGAGQGANVAATAAGPMVPVQYGTGGAFSFGSKTLTALVGAGASNGTTGPMQGNTTGATMSPVSPNSVEKGLAPAAVISNPPSSAALTLECWVQDIPNGATVGGESILDARSLPLPSTNGGVPAQELELTLAFGGAYAQVNLYDVDGNPSGFAVASSHAVNDGGLHHIATTYDGLHTLAVYVDGVLVASSSSASTLPPASVSNVYVGTGGGGPGLWPGTIAHIAVYASALSAARIASHYNAGVNAFPESSGNRFTRLLAYGPWNGGSVVPAGDTNLLGLTDCATKSVLAALLDVCTYENGNMFVDNRGRIVFENRHARMTQVNPVWTFGENTSAGEIPYEDGVVIDFDPINVFNGLVMQRPGGAIYNFFDAASMLANFPRTWPNNPLVVPIDTDQNLYYFGQFIIGRYKNPAQRIEQVQFRPSSNPALYPFVAQVQIGQRVRFNRRPRDASSMISLDFFVESIAHEYDPSTGEFVTTLECSPGIWNHYGVLTATRGTLNASTLAGATTFVVNATPTAGNTLYQDGWTPSAIPSIQIVDGANTETLAVTTLTSVGSQVTITTAAGAAHAHAAGVVVAENPGTYTYNQFDAGAVLDDTQQLSY